VARQFHRYGPLPPLGELGVGRAGPKRAVAVKLPGHGINDRSFLQPDRPMSAIGG